MLSKTDRLIQQQIAGYFSRLSAVTKIALLMRSPSVNMNEDGEADANDLASEFETDRTRQKIRRDLAKFRQRIVGDAGEGTAAIKLKKEKKTFASHFSFIFIVFAHENNWQCLGISSREICKKPTRQITAGSFLF